VAKNKPTSLAKFRLLSTKTGCVKLFIKYVWTLCFQRVTFSLLIHNQSNEEFFNEIDRIRQHKYVFNINILISPITRSLYLINDRTSMYLHQWLKGCNELFLKI